MSQPPSESPNTVQIRPRRSVLYVPGTNTRALQKATRLPADAVILDLEDAVAPDAKPDARHRVSDLARSGAFGHREVIIRVNGIDTPWHDQDVRAVASSGANGLLVPKLQSTQDIHAVEAAIQAAGGPAELRLWAMIETPIAVLRVADIAAAGTRLDTLVLGTNDLADELSAQPGPDRAELATALSLCLLAARAHGLTILDGVFNDTTDTHGFTAEARQGRAMGFDGKTLIHPSQIDPCNTAFTPSNDELTHAQRVIQAFQEAHRSGQGVATVDGQMIENLHARQAHQIIALRAAVDTLNQN
jgi:citrate lyase subunit beta/citryl-CoA lyase